MGEWLLSRKDRLIVARHEYLFSRVSLVQFGIRLNFDLTIIEWIQSSRWDGLFSR
jgi:hypothetical protein